VNLISNSMARSVIPVIRVVSEIWVGIRGSTDWILTKQYMN
jgi:hypothetical protein